ncbi:toluene tolerance protein [Stutzerimonas stutzeri]|uniref:toluene tolerance protein n=1 Tax=Stutzerimonas stutzeri TaxID=316 RepID=UPI0037239D59
MRIVTAQQLENWLAKGRILEQDARGPKVLALESEQILKIFYTRRRAIFARLKPPAERFARNCQGLSQRGISAPTILETLWLNQTEGLSACIYKPLPGQSLDRLIKECDFLEANLSPLAAFILELHRKGVYFRSLHLGNILKVDEQRFGLIDVLDLKFHRSPLSQWLVRRNFDHLRNYLARRNVDFPIDALIRRYEALARMP